MKFLRCRPCLSVSYWTPPLAFVDPEILGGVIYRGFHFNFSKAQSSCARVMLECLNACGFFSYMNNFLGDICVGLWLEEIGNILALVLSVVELFRLELKFLSALHISICFVWLFYLLLMSIINVFDLDFRHIMLFIIVSGLWLDFNLLVAPVSLGVHQLIA